MGDLVQVMEGGTLSVQATGTRQQTEKMEKYFLLFGSLKLILSKLRLSKILDS